MPDKCPLCGRELGDVNIDRHHLIPKLKKGKDQYPIHRICHRKIHSVFTEAELANYYHTWDRLREHSDIQAFVTWVQKKDPGYYDGSKETARRRSKRR